MKEEILERVQKKGQTRSEKVNWLREELHHLILQETDRSEGFKNLCFLGGTALRILFDLDRFSEDLDFSVSENSAGSFGLVDLSKPIHRALTAYGFECDVGRFKTVQAVHSCFFQFSGLLRKLDKSFDPSQKLVIKFDVDTNPPRGAVEATSPVTGAHLYTVRHYDLPSLFAGKICALLYRSYTKGRDLYDFLWYRGRGVKINRIMFENAVEQSRGVKVVYTEEKLYSELTERIGRVDFDAARKDVSPFLRDSRAISLLQKENFLAAIQGLAFTDDHTLKIKI